MATEHRPDGTCCEPVTVRLGRNLRDRARPSVTGFGSYSYAEKLAPHDGALCRALHTFTGPTGLPYAYTVELPGGELVHLPRLFVDEEV